MSSTTIRCDTMQREHRFEGDDVPGEVVVFNPDPNRTADYEVSHFQSGHASFVEVCRLPRGERRVHQLLPDGAEFSNNGRTDLVLSWEGATD